MHIRDRIKELRRVRAGSLCPNPKNWRTHPEKQRAALQGILAEIGYADALLVRELPDGRLMLIDGHLRAETTPEQEVPVLVLDLDEAESEKLLAVLDPLAGLAGTDEALLAELVERIETDSVAIREMLDGMIADADAAAQELFEEAGKEPEIPELYQIAVSCEDEEDQRVLFERLRGEGRQCRIMNL